MGGCFIGRVFSRCGGLVRGLSFSLGSCVFVFLGVSWMERLDLGGGGMEGRSLDVIIEMFLFLIF